MSEPTEPPITTPTNAPDLGGDAYTVFLRLLTSADGRRLFVPTPEQLDLKWRDVRDQNRIAWANASPDDVKAFEAQQDAAEALDRELFAQVEEQCADVIRTYNFRFRKASVDDQSHAAVKAGIGTDRSEIEYRKTLAERTFLTTDWPGFSTMGALDSDVGMLLFAEVVRRVSLSTSVRDFLPRRAGASVPASA